MKSKVSILLLAVFSLFSLFVFVSCKGKSGKQLVKVAEEAVGNYRPKPGPGTIKNIKKGYDYITKDEDQYVAQPVYLPCSQCGGGGIVYAYDAYGYLQSYTCSACGGGGQVMVYQ